MEQVSIVRSINTTMEYLVQQFIDRTKVDKS